MGKEPDRERAHIPAGSAAAFVGLFLLGMAIPLALYCTDVIGQRWLKGLLWTGAFQGAGAGIRVVRRGVRNANRDANKRDE